MWISYQTPCNLLNVVLIIAGIHLIDAVTITCPNNIIQYADVGEISTSVTWPSPVTSADTIQVISTHNPGHVFFVGSSNVVYVAQDGTGDSATCGFLVTIIRDDIPIVTNCPLDQIVTSDTGSDSTSLTWTPPTFTDETGMLVPTSSHDPGDTFLIGETQVIYEVIDVTNNTAVCMFTITVQDNEDPTFTGCPASTSGIALFGTTIPISWTPPTANDNSGLAVSITTTHDPGENFDIGNSPVTYSAVDQAGNIALCTFTVSIQETTGPVWNNCPPSQSVHNDPGEASAIVSWTEPTANDADDVPAVTATHNPGDTFDIGVTLVTYMATDGDGFMASCAFAITVADAENPVINNCPSDISTIALATNIPVQLLWRQPMASDNLAKSDLLVSSHNPGDTFPSGQTQVGYAAIDDAGNQVTCTFIIDVQVVDPLDTTSYNGTLGLDRIGSVDGPFTSSSGLLSQSLIKELDSVLRSSSISANYVGIDSITVSLNNAGIAVLEYMLYVLQDAGYSVTVIEESFEDNLIGADEDEFLSGNKVVNASFVLGICPVDFCQNNGQCYLDKDNFVSLCQCPSGYTGSECQSRVILSQTLIIIISVTSGIFLLVLILLVICCILTCGNDETKETEKFPLTDAEKARGIHNPVVMATRGMQNGGSKGDMFYPNGVTTNITSRPVQNGGLAVPPKVVPANGTPTRYPQPRLIPINSNDTGYVPPYPPPRYQNARTYYVPPKDDSSGPRFQHKTPPSILKNRSHINGNYRYITDGNYRYVVDDRSGIAPLRRTRSYGDDWLLNDHDDHRRRRRKRHRKRRTRSLGHQFVFTLPAQDVPRLRRRRRRHRAKRTTSLRLPGDKYRIPARDYTLPRELTQQFVQHEQRQSGIDSSDNSRDRSRQLEHLNLETRRLKPQNFSHHSPSAVPTSQTIDDVPPPPNIPPPPPPTPPGTNH